MREIRVARAADMPAARPLSPSATAPLSSGSHVGARETCVLKKKVDSDSNYGLRATGRAERSLL